MYVRDCMIPCSHHINSLSDDEIRDNSKLKESAEDKSNVADMTNFMSDRKENTYVQSDLALHSPQNKSHCMYTMGYNSVCERRCMQTMGYNSVCERHCMHAYFCGICRGQYHYEFNTTPHNDKKVVNHGCFQTIQSGVTSL